MSTLRAAFFVKNLPGWERAARLLVAAITVAGALLALPPPWGWIGAAAGAGLGVTGMIGFCPMCALWGRRLPETR
jgi:hypothetical protein